MSLKHEAASGVKWTTTSTVVTTSLSFIQTIVLARLLSPEDFGLMAMIMVVLGFAQAYADMGISNAIIHRQDTTRSQLSTLYWLNVLSGIVVFGIILAVRPLIVHFYGEPRLHGLLLWSALVFLITPLGQQFQIMLQKELQFKKLSVIEIGSICAGVALSIFCAAVGSGVMALIWGQLCTSATKMLMLVSVGIKRQRPALHFCLEDMKGYLQFGLYQMGEKSINYFNSHLDQLLIGSLVGAQVLGYYNLAFNLVIVPVAKINPILTRVAFPLFARVQSDNERLKRGYLLVQRTLSLVNFPLLLGLAVVAPLFVTMVFGPQWQPSVILIQILSVVALLRSTGNPVGSLLLAKGRPDLGLNFNAMKLVTQIPGVYLGAYLGGGVGVAWVLLALQFVYTSVGYAFLVRGVLGPCLREYVMSMAPALALSATMAASVGLATVLVHRSSLPFLSAQIVFGAVVYLILILLFQRHRLAEVKNILAGR
jgi:O-antigen/teichoic acid export membrane protein